MEIIVNVFPPDYNKVIEDSDAMAKLALFKHESKIEIYELFKERLKEYEQYLKEKKETKLKRNETQVLLEPPQRED